MPSVPPTSHVPTPSPSRSPAAMAARLFLVLLPIGHLVYLPVSGAMGTGADVVLLVFLLAWGMDLLVRPGRASALGRGFRRAPDPASASDPGRMPGPGLPDRGSLVGYALLIAYGGWVAASAAWGFHPRYAIAKGLGTGALALGALALATSEVGWRRASDAWLTGTGLALAFTVLAASFGSEALRARVYSGGSGVVGLPFPRVSGPLLHPNMFGGYLVVSGLLLWARWPELTGAARAAGVTLAAALGSALLFTASTAWIGGGVAVALIGRRVGAEGRRGVGALLRVGGSVTVAAVLAALVVPLDCHVGGLHVVTNAIRPAIWRSSLDAVIAGPIVGVGAAPYLAEAADPLRSGAVGLWDAHNAYLSVLGQFGVVGFGLLVGGVILVARSVWRRSGPSRARTAVLLALAAVAVHGVFLANEDLRHVWMVVGMAGVVGAGSSSGEAS